MNQSLGSRLVGFEPFERARYFAVLMS